jgi:peptide/nickel transport system substrate-binding protein
VSSTENMLAVLFSHIRFFLSMSSSHWLQRVSALRDRLSPIEQLLIVAALVVVVVFFFRALFLLTHRNTVVWPQVGGHLVTGGVGTPRLIHPLYAETSTERDLVALVYVGLLKELDDGQIIPALAESFEQTPDGSEYIFHLRTDAVFHDGAPVTADDIVYTLQQAQEPEINDYLAVTWNKEDVTVEKIDTHTVRITNTAGYADFIEYATLGIVPLHIWGDLTPDEQLLSGRMTDAVGAGPFRVSNIETDTEDIIQGFTLQRSPSYVLGEPYLKSITYKLFETHESLLAAYSQGNLDMARLPFGIPAMDGEVPHIIPTTTVMGMFVSRTTTSPLAEHDVVEALSLLIDREELINAAYAGYAPPQTSSLPQPWAPELEPDAFDPGRAHTLLAEAGWTITMPSDTIGGSSDASDTASTPLSFTLATLNTPHLVAAAEYIREHLVEYNIEVTVDIYTSEAFYDDVIPNRSFDALLFGLSLEVPSSLNIFWHSRHRKAYNITEYTNTTTDDLLDKARIEFDPVLRKALYEQFDMRLAEDRPAIMLYSLALPIVSDDRFSLSFPATIDTRHQQFDLAHQWYRHGAAVWGHFRQR